MKRSVLTDIFKVIQSKDLRKICGGKDGIIY